MITGNSTVTEINDTLIISKMLALNSIASFTTFADDVTGESASNVFDKQFRYSFDGVNYTDFIACTNANFLAIDLTDRSYIFFNFLYTVLSIVDGETMAFNSLTLNGNIEIKINTNFDITKNSAYKKIYRDNKDLLLLTDNLTKKLYYNGINPTYLPRNEEDNADIDFINFSRSNAEFFGLNSVLAEQYEKLFDVYYLLYEYLTEKSIVISHYQSISDLQYIVQNFYDEVRKRGTIQFNLRKGWRLPTNQQGVDYAVEQQVDGELLRMIGYQQQTDEFIWHLFRNSEIGWWVDNCSPLYKGNTHIDSQINKSLIDAKDFLGVQTYNLNEGLHTGSSEVNTADGTKNVLKIDGTAGFVAINNIVDSLDYELTFFIKTATTFDVAILPQDINGTALPIKDNLGATIVNGEVISAGTTLSGNNYYFIRCILYNKNAIDIVSTTNLGIGKNAINSEGAIKCTWKIDSTDANIWDVKIKPLNRPYDTGFIQPANWVEFYLGNKNGKYNLNQIKDFIRHYLIQYNNTFSVIDFAPVINNVAGADAIVTLNTARVFGNLTMLGENEYVDPVNGTIQIIDIWITDTDTVELLQDSDDSFLQDSDDTLLEG